MCRSHTVDFTTHPDAKKDEKGEKVVYYQTNPTPNWGPAQRAKVVKAPAPGQAKRKSEEGGEGVDGEIKRAKMEVAAGEEEGMNA
jgi:tRNA (guanine26-N2/guanine27-N2)-dimethyltransferase